MNSLFSGNTKFLNILLTTLVGSVLLVLGRQLFVPVSYALLISFILYPVCKWLEARGIGKATAIIIGITLVVLLFLLMLFVLGWQFRSFMNEWPLVREKLIDLGNNIRRYLVDVLGFSEQQINERLQDFLDKSGSSSIQELGTSLSALFLGLFTLFIIPVFTFLILLYRQRLMMVVFNFFPPERKSRIEEVIRLAINTYYNFVKGVLVVYAIVGTLNSIGLLILGVPHAILFGYLTAVMTFIPYVGIIIASLLPISYAWITYNSVWYPLGVVGIFAFVQYLEANVIFPWAVSHRLELNTLVTLIVIIAGGIIWGASGMILFVPFAAILKLIADRLEGWEQVSLLLGDKPLPGKIKKVS